MRVVSASMGPSTLRVAKERRRGIGVMEEVRVEMGSGIEVQDYDFMNELAQGRYNGVEGVRQMGLIEYTPKEDIKFDSFGRVRKSKPFLHFLEKKAKKMAGNKTEYEAGFQKGGFYKASKNIKTKSHSTRRSYQRSRIYYQHNTVDYYTPETPTKIDLVKYNRKLINDSLEDINTMQTFMKNLGMPQSSPLGLGFIPNIPTSPSPPVTFDPKIPSSTHKSRNNLSPAVTKSLTKSTQSILASSFMNSSEASESFTFKPKVLKNQLITFPAKGRKTAKRRLLRSNKRKQKSLRQLGKVSYREHRVDKKSQMVSS